MTIVVVSDGLLSDLTDWKGLFSLIRKTLKIFDPEDQGGPKGQKIGPVI